MKKQPWLYAAALGLVASGCLDPLRASWPQSVDQLRDATLRVYLGGHDTLNVVLILPSQAGMDCREAGDWVEVSLDGRPLDVGSRGGTGSILPEPAPSCPDWLWWNGPVGDGPADGTILFKDASGSITATVKGLRAERGIRLLPALDQPRVERWPVFAAGETMRVDWVPATDRMERASVFLRCHPFYTMALPLLPGPPHECSNLVAGGGWIVWNLGNGFTDGHAQFTLPDEADIHGNVTEGYMLVLFGVNGGPGMECTGVAGCEGYFDEGRETVAVAFMAATAP